MTIMYLVILNVGYFDIISGIFSYQSQTNYFTYSDMRLRTCGLLWVNIAAPLAIHTAIQDQKSRRVVAIVPQSSQSVAQSENGKFSNLPLISSAQRRIEKLKVRVEQWVAPNKGMGLRVNKTANRVI